MTDEELEILEKQLYENKKVICVINKENKILYKLACRDDPAATKMELCIMIPKEYNEDRVITVTEVVPKRSIRFEKTLKGFEEAVNNPDNKIEPREAKK